LLVDDEELAHWSDPGIVERGARVGVDVRRHPIPDGEPPADAADMRRILEDVRVGRANGDVAVACMGGVGRTGTVAACALVEAGMQADAAIAKVRAVRHPQAVETAAQEAFVRAFAAAEAG
jgi:protein-tyrosine phosphatase